MLVICFKYFRRCDELDFCIYVLFLIAACPKLHGMLSQKETETLVSAAAVVPHTPQMRAEGGALGHRAHRRVFFPGCVWGRAQARVGGS